MCAIGGAIGGALFAEDLEVWGGIGGFVSGLLTPFCVQYYVMLRSEWGDTYHTVEMVIPGGIAAIPGFLIYWIGKWRQDN